MGTPVSDEIDVGDLSGPDGTLDGSLTGAMVQGNSTIIADAWCNTSHKLTMTATPMELQNLPAYAQPAYMARKVTYDATLIGWSSPLGVRTHNGGDMACLSTSESGRATGRERVGTTGKRAVDCGQVTKKTKKE